MILTVSALVLHMLLVRLPVSMVDACPAIMNWQAESSGPSGGNNDRQTGEPLRLEWSFNKQESGIVPMGAVCNTLEISKFNKGG